MRKIMLLLFLAVVNINALSQRKSIDSLSFELAKAKHDTTKVMILSSLATAYKYVLMTDSALYRLKQGLNLARQAGFPKGEAICLNGLGALAGDKGNTSKAIEFFVQAIKINEKIGELRGMSFNLNNIGAFYLKPGSYKVALQYFLRSLQILEEAERLAPTAPQPYNGVISGNIGFCYRQLGMYDSAKFYADQTYRKGKSNNNIFLVAAGLIQLGSVSASEGHYGVALEYLREALQFVNRAGISTGQRTCRLEMANLFEKMNNIDSALYYARKTATADIASGRLLDLDVSSTLLSRIHKKLNNKDSSMHYLELVIATRDTLAAREQRAEAENIIFNEQIRQLDIAAAREKEREERSNNLQYAAIALGVVLFIIIFFLLSHSIIANQRMIRFLGILALLIVFEFINLFIHPYLDKWTNHSIPLMLLAMVCIAALLIPLHHKLEHWITHKLVDKNNKIRLAAARKTIAKLEGLNAISENPNPQL